MKVWVVGSGGREHALVWKLSQEASVVWLSVGEVREQLLGPAGKVVEIPDLVVIGPEDPLIDGLADDLRARGIRVYGPNADGARLEGSKAFCKEVMDAAGVPTAKFRTFTDSQAAKGYTTTEWNEGRPVVVKASGAALGKGVVVPADLPEALDAINAMMERGELGDAGKEIVLEQRLNGFEFSLLVLVSGTESLSLPVAQDYKRAFDGDEGPNTGGMGTYSPVPHVTPELVRRTEREVIEPTLKELRSRGIDYRGTLFAGLMVQDGEPYCLEFNVRFGDPETQTVMRRLGAGFLDALVACAEGRAVPEIEVLDNAVVTVVLAAQGYPGAYEKGHRVNAPSLKDNLVLFRAGMTEDGISTGGRVLGVSAAAQTLEQARSDAYAAVDKIDAPGLFCRRDIAAL